MSIMDPEKKRIAQKVKWRHKLQCRRCQKHYRGRLRCPRCGSKERREIHHDTKPKGRKD